ncbi:hypothetical protein N9I78_02320 [Flavobacteriaceae bacterium]|nr:hypothetical protein [Flavobacteriaceae bacterium]
MSKAIITFFFSMIILASIVSPTFINLHEFNVEITEIVDYGEEEKENKGNESLKDIEVKIYYINDKVGTVLDLKKNKRIRFLSRNYTFSLTELNSPPPEKFLI